MSSPERVIEAGLSEQAWNNVQAAFLSADYENGTFAPEVIANDGALWRHYYFETIAGPAISLVRETEETVTSYALQSDTREIAFVSVNRRASLTDKLSDMGFQAEMGMTIPTGDDLRTLEAFLVPQT